MRRFVAFLLAGASVLQVHVAAAQLLTGTLIGTVKDAQGGVLPKAIVRLSSPALIGGTETLRTNEKGQLRFPALPPGLYVLDIEAQGFFAYHEEDIRIGAGATLERAAVLSVAGIEESFVVGGAGSRIEARGSGFETRFGPEDLKTIPVRRFSMFDVRMSRTIAFGRSTRVELLVDLLNALNDPAEEGLATDNKFSPNFGQPAAFVDPRRAMVGLRLSVGR
jgi:hypothetical protein